MVNVTNHEDAHMNHELRPTVLVLISGIDLSSLNLLVGAFHSF
jgi:hypothetical protein